MILYPAAIGLLPSAVSATFVALPSAVATRVSPVSRLPLVTVTVVFVRVVPSYVLLSSAAVIVIATDAFVIVSLPSFVVTV